MKFTCSHTSGYSVVQPGYAVESALFRGPSFGKSPSRDLITVVEPIAGMPHTDPVLVTGIRTNSTNSKWQTLMLSGVHEGTVTHWHVMRQILNQSLICGCHELTDEDRAYGGTRDGRNGNSCCDAYALFAGLFAWRAMGRYSDCHLTACRAFSSVCVTTGLCRQ